MAKFDELVRHLISVKTNRIQKESSLKKYFNELRTSLVNFLGCEDDLVSISYLDFDSPYFNATLTIDIPLGERTPFGDLGTIASKFLLSGEYLDNPFILFNNKKFTLDPNGRELFLQEIFNSLMALNV